MSRGSKMDWAKLKAQDQLGRTRAGQPRLRGRLERIGPDCAAGHQTYERTVKATAKRFWCCTSKTTVPSPLDAYRLAAISSTR